METFRKIIHFENSGIVADMEADIHIQMGENRLNPALTVNVYRPTGEISFRDGVKFFQTRKILQRNYDWHSPDYDAFEEAMEWLNILDAEHPDDSFWETQIEEWGMTVRNKVRYFFDPISGEKDTIFKPTAEEIQEAVDNIQEPKKYDVPQSAVAVAMIQSLAQVGVNDIMDQKKALATFIHLVKMLN